MIATFFRSCKVESMVIVQAYPRKLSPKPVENVDNNPIFSVLQNPHPLEIGSIRFLWKRGVKSIPKQKDWLNFDFKSS